jgi:hypothetical protein
MSLAESGVWAAGFGLRLSGFRLPGFRLSAFGYPAFGEAGRCLPVVGFHPWLGFIQGPPKLQKPEAPEPVG